MTTHQECATFFNMDSNEITVTIDSQGTATFLIGETTQGFLDERAIISRASHVEPSNRGLRWMFHLLRFGFGEDGRISDWTRRWQAGWRVNLSPVNGPILPTTFTDRNAAIDAEVEWLTEHWL